MSKGSVGVVGGREVGVVDRIACAFWYYYSGNFVILSLTLFYVFLFHYV